MLVSGSLWVLPAVDTPSRTVEVAVLVVANALATEVQFLALRPMMTTRPR